MAGHGQPWPTVTGNVRGHPCPAVAGNDRPTMASRGQPCQPCRPWSTMASHGQPWNDRMQFRIRTKWSRKQFRFRTKGSRMQFRFRTRMQFRFWSRWARMQFRFQTKGSKMQFVSQHIFFPSIIVEAGCVFFVGLQMSSICSCFFQV